MSEIKLNVLLIEQESWWIAQGLEYDIGAQAFSLKDVMYELQRNIIGYMAICSDLGEEPLANLPSAPQKYWNMWRTARIEVSADREPFRAPLPQMIDTEIRLAS